MTDQTTETARALLYRHGLPEDVIDGALCLHAQELAAVQREFADQEDAHLATTSAAVYVQGIRDGADRIDPTNDAALTAVLPATTNHATDTSVTHRCADCGGEFIPGSDVELTHNCDDHREAEPVEDGDASEDRRQRYATPLYAIMRQNGWDGERTDRVVREMDLVLNAVITVADTEQQELRAEMERRTLMLQASRDVVDRLRADRAVVLREAADVAERVAIKRHEQHEIEREQGAYDVMTVLRRVADETAATETPDEAWQREWDRRPDGADVSDLFEIVAVVPCSGTLFSAHQPHTWEPQPGAPAVHCLGERQPAAGARQDEPVVTVHAVPMPGSNGISACCGRPPCEFVGERVTRDPDKVTCTGPAAGARQDGAQPGGAE